MTSKLIHISTWVMLAALAVDEAHAQKVSGHDVLIGAPVFAADGGRIGSVADIATTDDNEVEAIRVRTGAALGFGERVVLIPQPAFMIKGSRVWLPDLTVQDVESFPDAPPDGETLADH
jgi:hypothetical protein